MSFNGGSKLKTVIPFSSLRHFFLHQEIQELNVTVEEGQILKVVNDSGENESRRADSFIRDFFNRATKTVILDPEGRQIKPQADDDAEKKKNALKSMFDDEEQIRNLLENFNQDITLNYAKSLAKLLLNHNGKPPYNEESNTGASSQIYYNESECGFILSSRFSIGRTINVDDISTQDHNNCEISVELVLDSNGYHIKSIMVTDEARRLLFPNLAPLSQATMTRHEISVSPSLEARRLARKLSPNHDGDPHDGDPHAGAGGEDEPAQDQAPYLSGPTDNINEFARRALPADRQALADTINSKYQEQQKDDQNSDSQATKNLKASLRNIPLINADSSKEEFWHLSHIADILEVINAEEPCKDDYADLITICLENPQWQDLGWQLLAMADEITIGNEETVADKLLNDKLWLRHIADELIWQLTTTGLDKNDAIFEFLIAERDKIFPPISTDDRGAANARASIDKQEKIEILCAIGTTAQSFASKSDIPHNTDILPFSEGALESLVNKIESSSQDQYNPWVVRVAEELKSRFNNPYCDENEQQQITRDLLELHAYIRSDLGDTGAWSRFKSYLAQENSCLNDEIQNAFRQLRSRARTFSEFHFDRLQAEVENKDNPWVIQVARQLREQFDSANVDENKRQQLTHDLYELHAYAKEPIGSEAALSRISKYVDREENKKRLNNVFNQAREEVKAVDISRSRDNGIPDYMSTGLMETIDKKYARAKTNSERFGLGECQAVSKAVINGYANPISCGRRCGEKYAKTSTARKIGAGLALVGTALIGLTLFSASIALAVGTLGVSSPLSALGAAIGGGIVAQSVAATAAAVAGGTTAYVGYGAFKLNWLKRMVRGDVSGRMDALCMHQKRDDAENSTTQYRCDTGDGASQ